MDESIKLVAAYGLWESPVSADLISGNAISIHEVVVNVSERLCGMTHRLLTCSSTKNRLQLVTSITSSRGRYCIVESIKDGNKDILPAEFNARADVNEMGGGAIAISPSGHLIFTDANTRGVYSLDPSTKFATQILNGDPLIRFADFDVHPINNNWIVAIKEDHRNATPETQATDVINNLVAIDITTNTSHVIVEGSDFYSHPRFSPDGAKISWIQWSHPDMPWTGSVLHTADWLGGRIENITAITGQAKEVSISQPRWGPDGSLFFASDVTGHWQLYFTRNGAEPQRIKLEGLENTDFSVPEWTLGR
jgi:hypothetical protein